MRQGFWRECSEEEEWGRGQQVVLAGQELSLNWGFTRSGSLTAEQFSPWGKGVSFNPQGSQFPLGAGGASPAQGSLLVKENSSKKGQLVIINQHSQQSWGRGLKRSGQVPTEDSPEKSLSLFLSLSHTHTLLNFRDFTGPQKLWPAGSGPLTAHLALPGSHLILHLRLLSQRK